ncbi:nitrite reductase small subunit NirD [Halalkalibacter krulwichiae]|uniref:Assimilatory nitrite reductase [NAD(P)H] small subunit n=1 Tax=Halalkalibacter krulwichiae TaxID=199441 RepID=A0A1X9M7C6_9BACI|nr:nitrite reductase small subunit NirD [Halalkalibacter krulwichiae]ARK28584.1 Assimilatory nitrite reductase [NAD(P)H] small subunit [Halalkalibacter krulwichiae]
MSKVDQLKRVEVAALQDLSVGIGKRVNVSGEEIALFKQKGGTVSAIQNSCPHKGGPLSEGIVSGEHVFCPLHDWKINMKDGQVQAPDVGCVKKYEVEIVGEKVYIFVD